MFRVLASINPLLVAVLVIVGVAATSCDSVGPSPIGSCTDLANAYQTDMQSACKADSGWVSGFCSTCVKHNLFSYTKAPGGVCVCAPLTLTDGVCAGTEDEGKIVSAIVAADGECATYSLEAPDSGRAADADVADSSGGAGGGP